MITSTKAQNQRLFRRLAYAYSTPARRDRFEVKVKAANDRWNQRYPAQQYAKAELLAQERDNMEAQVVL